MLGSVWLLCYKCSISRGLCLPTTLWMCLCAYASMIVPVCLSSRLFLCLCHHDCAFVFVPSWMCLCWCHHVCASVLMPSWLFLCVYAIIIVPVCLCHHDCAFVLMPSWLFLCVFAIIIVPVSRLTDHHLCYNVQAHEFENVFRAFQRTLLSFFYFWPNQYTDD